MAWNNAVVTNRGVEMLREAAENGTLTFVSASGSDSTYPNASLMAQTAPANEKQTFSITKISDVAGGKKLCVQITNKGLTHNYFMKQLCIWAKVNDGTPEVLAIIQDDTGILIHTENEITDYLLTFYALLKIDNVAEMNVTVDSSCFATVAALVEHENDTAKHLTDKEQTFSGVKTFAVPPKVPEPTEDNQAAPKGYIDTSLAKIATNKDTAPCGRVLVSNGDGTGQFKKLDIPPEYVHPSRAGYKHIPSGGDVGDILQNTDNGIAKWVRPDVLYETPKKKIFMNGNQYVPIVKGFMYHSGDRRGEPYASVGTTTFGVSVGSDREDEEETFISKASVTTDIMVNVSNWDYLVIKYTNSSRSKGGDTDSYLILSTIKIGSASEYNHRMNLTRHRDGDYMPIRNITGNFYIRINSFAICGEPYDRASSSTSVAELYLTNILPEGVE